MNKYRIWLGLLGLLALAGCLCLVLGVILLALRDRPDATVALFQTYCDQPGPVAIAGPPAPPGERRNLLVFGPAPERTPIEAPFPRGWQPGPDETVQLIACLETTTVLVQRCDYHLDPDRDEPQVDARVRRFITVLDVSVYAPLTGEVIGRRRFSGEPPRACAPEERFPRGQSFIELLGPAPDYALMSDWLASLVEPPAEPTPGAPGDSLSRLRAPTGPPVAS